MHEYQQRHPDWFFVRHEDLSTQPVDGYTKMFGELGLDFTDDIRATIEEYSGTANPGQAPADVGAFKIDSTANVTTAWKQRLTPDEIFRIREGTADVSQFFMEMGSGRCVVLHPVVLLRIYEIPGNDTRGERQAFIGLEVFYVGAWNWFPRTRTGSRCGLECIQHFLSDHSHNLYCRFGF